MREPCVVRESSRGYDLVCIEDEMMRSREIFLYGEVNAGSMNILLKQLMYLDREDPGRGITLYINSPGGEVQSGLAVYDWIRLMRSPLKTVCVGSAASMGAILFLAGKDRLMTEHSRLMIHDPAPGGGSLAGMKPDEIEERLEELKKIQDAICRIITETTGMPESDVRACTRKDTYYSASEAKAAGLATGIMKGR